MPRRSARLLVFLATLTALMSNMPAPLFAALGGNASSIDADRVHVEGALTQIVRSDAYSIHEIRSASGTMIREYVSSSSGTVFAVVWQGPWIPDLRQVLGDHFDHYQRAVSAAQRAHKGRASLVVRDPDLVVQMSGHQRSFFGRAYVPELMPQRVQPEVIR
jgi:hypothetical protein